MLQKTLLFLLLSIILILVKADKDNPLDYLKDAFDIVRPSSVIEGKNENVTFHCKPAKNDHFDECLFKTATGKTFLAELDGTVFDLDTNETVHGMQSYFESNGESVCGLEIQNFISEHFGWWSCHLNVKVSKVNHVGTFKINQKDFWPTDIRLPNNFKVKAHSGEKTLANNISYSMYLLFIYEICYSSILYFNILQTVCK
jgi:hypothetical protein